MGDDTDATTRRDARVAESGRSAGRRLLRALLLMVSVVLSVTVGWWAWGRLGADARALQVLRDETGSPPTPVADSAPTLRLLTWNIAHGRGTANYGLLRNFRGGDPEARRERLRRIAAVIREQEADVVVLNEADFDATWSHGVDQSAHLAEWAGYPVRVRQANYDLRLPFLELHFGNAVLSRLPVGDARLVELPPHHPLEPRLLGAKSASVIRLASPGGPVALVPVHLEARSPETRRAALPRLTGVAATEDVPVILAGDFNASPPAWGDPVQRVGIGRGSPAVAEAPAAPSSTVIGELLQAGYRSPRAVGVPSADQWTYPAPAPDRAIDWVLVEPPLEVVEAHVLRGPEVDSLSDHRPVLAVIRLPSRAEAEAADAVPVGAGTDGEAHPTSEGDGAKERR